MSDSEEQMRRIDVMIRMAAAAKLSPESVDFGPATGLSRCGLCRYYQPAENPMYGSCEIVDKYRVERNTTCDRFEPSAPSTSGEHGGTVAKKAAEFYNMVEAATPALPALIASNEALVGRVKMHRASMEQRYGWVQPKVFAKVAW